MLPSSVRRVVSSAASSAAPQTGVVSSLASAAPKSAPLFVRGHQRRCSSSKPSRSDNGSSSEISARESVPASSARGEGKAGSEKRKRKNNKDSERASAFKNLPSVPNTHHMSQEALGLSSFFSLHRPISVTQTMPRTVTEDHFASIFAGRSKASKNSEVMSTLSDTIDQLEGPMAQMTIAAQQDGQGDAMHKVDIRNVDGSESSMYLQIDAMSGEFLPFRPPPLPQPQPSAATDAAESAAAAETAEVAEDFPQHRVYKALFTIEESTDPDGQIRIMAHSPRIMRNGAQQPRSFLERLALRQLKFDEAQGSRQRDMHAISVKRQRKLKMKKKKYKKLMKRTRTLRRKLDRT